MRCFAFHGDGRYVWDDRYPGAPANALVPFALHRWQGRAILQGDSLIRWRDTDDIYSGFDGKTLVPYSLDDSTGGIIVSIRLEPWEMTVTSTAWVAVIGPVDVTDVYRRGREGECGQPMPGIVR
jgi:hypothetical protein